MVEGGIGFGDLVAVAEGHEAGDGEGEDEFGVGGAGVDAAEAAFLGDDEVDGAADAVVVDADGYDVVAVVGYGGGDGAAFQPEVADKGFCHGGGIVAVDHDYLQDIFFGVAVQVAVRGQGVPYGDDQPIGDELAVEGFDEIDLFDIFFLAPFVYEIGKVGGDVEVGVELIDRGGGEQGAGAGGSGCRCGGRKMGRSL
jgi:hypothetical protein